MRESLKIAGLVGIFCMTSLAWMLLGGIMMARSESQSSSLIGAVSDLWGSPHTQMAPTAEYVWKEQYTQLESVLDANRNPVLRDGMVMQQEVLRERQQSQSLRLDSTRVTADLHLDQRRKGLMWFPLYDVNFQGKWTVTVEGEDADGVTWLHFDFPVTDGVYDDFVLAVNGVNKADEYPPEGGQVSVPITAQPGDVLELEVSYRSRGMTTWEYSPGHGVGQLRDFELLLTTDFKEIDFPAFTLAPSEKTPTDTGWLLSWTFTSLITGHGMGMVMPEPIQPGPLAASMSLSAPISLGLFMLWIYVLGLLRGIDIHPINHLFLAATFFSFHLLFGYTVDHIAVEWAFALSSVVSLGLTISYLRLVAGPRFALLEAGGAQLLYLVGFSLAHFWEGYTGLTVTVLGILTLFALGQLTGRIEWSKVFAGGTLRAAE